MFTLHNGDCLQVMPSIPSGSIDAIITDLPYGTTACKWDTVIEFSPMWKEVKRVLKPNGAFITTASQPFTSALIMSNPSMFRDEWIWEKSKATRHLDAAIRPMKAHENIIVFGSKLPKFNPQKYYSGRKDFRNVFTSKSKYVEILGMEKTIHSHSKDDGTRYQKSVLYYENNDTTQQKHPTQKPMGLFAFLCLAYSDEGDIILDIAMGSGTTIEAAERTGRNSIGIEKDEGIFQSAKKRLEA